MSSIQYTIRNIPEPVDQVLRKRASYSGKSFNQTVVELLTEQTLGSPPPPVKPQNFDWLFGKNTLDTDFDESIAEQSKPDPSLWE